jgi:hypothetical protein
MLEWKEGTRPSNLQDTFRELGVLHTLSDPDTLYIIADEPSLESDLDDDSCQHFELLLSTNI